MNIETLYDSMYSIVLPSSKNGMALSFAAA